MGGDFADFGTFGTVFEIMFGVVAVFVVVVVVLIVRTTIRSRKVLRDNGMDPLAAQAQIAVRLAQGPLGTPVKSLEQRLTELDDLHRRGLISTEEHAAARRAALTE